MTDLPLAKDISDAKKNIDGYRRAAEALLTLARREENRLADLNEMWDVTHEAEKELDRRPRLKGRL